MCQDPGSTTQGERKREKGAVYLDLKTNKIAPLMLFYLMIRVINILYPLLLCAHLCLV